MEDGINPEFFLHVQRAVERICEHALSEPKLVLTEGDLQSRIFADLAGDASISARGLHVHCHINYLKNETKLGKVPDIVILPSTEYSVDANGSLYDKKGYTVWGSSIALELKLLRSHRRGGFVSAVQKDFDKLKGIRQRLYTTDRDHSFFAASVVLCRQTLPERYVTQLQAASAEAQIPLWLFNKTEG